MSATKTDYNKRYYQTRFINGEWSGRGTEHICKECGKTFTRTRSDQQFHTGSCRSRAYNKINSRRDSLKKLYGLTEVQYDSLLEKQGGLCAICYTPPEEGSYLFVDHCHETKQVRKLLCRKCNTLLGMAKDSISVLLSAVAYLRGFHVSN